ncbi:MAG: DUF938 domain-containing protein [Pseudomonadota bacterium]
MKPDAPATGRNREPILAVLQRVLPRPGRVLEIGSGTGQHAVFFGERLPDVTWQCSDLTANLPGIRQWISEADLPNVPAPLELDVLQYPDTDTFDTVFTANTFHIMSWQAVCAMLHAVTGSLVPGGQLIVYGPFKRAGTFNAASNAAFDASLRAQAPQMGIRDFEDVNRQASAAGLEWVSAEAMPANNEILVWRLSDGAS